MAPYKNVVTPIQVETIVVVTDGSGNAATASTNKVSGEIVKVVYDLGTITSAPLVLSNYTALTGAVRESIDAFTLSASVYRYPSVGRTGASAGDNKWIKPLVINDNLLVTVSSGTASKTFTVYVYYR